MSTKTTSPAKQVETFIRKFDPEVAKLARTARSAMRKRFPTAVELVYDHYNGLAMGFGSTERTSDVNDYYPRPFKVMKRLILPLMLLATGVCYAQDPRVLPLPSRPFPERTIRTDSRTTRIRRDTYVAEYHPTKSEKKLLTPAPEDLQTFADFIRLPDAGLVRIFPAGNWRVVSVDQLETKQTPEFINFASRYSFTKTKHGHSLQGYVDPGLGWAEIKLEAEMLTTAFTRSSVGLLLSLGDVPLQTITPTTPGVDALAEFKRPSDHVEERRYILACREGFELNGFVYRASLPAKVNTTYVLRSINNKRADILVALRIIRSDENGSVTMLWRKLQTNPKPSWKRKT